MQEPTKKTILGSTTYTIYESANDSHIIVFEGELRVTDKSILVQIKKEITERFIAGDVFLDLTKLKSCNSSATQNFNQTFVEINNIKRISKISHKITVKGNSNSTWQTRSFYNFEVIFDNVDTLWENC